MDLWPITISARRSLLATFEGLDDDQWTVPTLCSEWTMHQMLAHLVLAAKPPRRRYAKAVIKARGSFDAANHRLAVEDAAKPVDTLLASYRSVVEYRFAPPGWPKAAPLSDILLHTLDVRAPLGIETDEEPRHYEPVLGLLFSRLGTSFTSAGRPDLRWVAVDHSWSTGSGAEVRGPMADLALTAAGRGARLDALEGDGVEALRDWLR